MVEDEDTMVDRLKMYGSVLPISTFKDLLSKVFASHKNSHHNYEFWTEEQWGKGIEGIPTANSTGQLEHWFHTDRFNTLINIIDKKFNTLLEKIEAFIAYVKTVDSAFASKLKSDEFNDPTLVRKMYESLYSDSLATGFFNLDNPTPENVCHLINKLGIVSKKAIQLHQIVNRMHALDDLKFAEGIKWTIKGTYNKSQLKSGSFSSIVQKVMQVSENEIEFELFLEKGTTDVPPTHYFLEIIIPGFSKDIKAMFCKIQVLEDLSVQRLGWIGDSIYVSETPVDKNTEMIVPVHFIVPNSFSHIHSFSGHTAKSTSGYVYTTDTAVDSSNEYFPISLNNDVFSEVGMSWYNKSGVVAIGNINHETTYSQTNTVNQDNYIYFKSVNIKGVLWTT